MTSLSGVRSQRKNSRPLSPGDMDYTEPKTKSNLLGKLLLLASLIILAFIVINKASSFTSPSVFSRREEGVTHVLVTGGAGYIGSHAALRLLKDKYRVTIVDNLSRGNHGAVKVLQRLFPQTGRLQFIYADLGDPAAVEKIFSENAFDAVMHFAAVAYVGESTLYPLKYYHNITSNTLGVLEAMARHKVKKLIYSSTCGTYGEPEKMPITEDTPQVPINPYGKAKKMAEDMILDFSKNSDMAVMILRYFNVIGSDPGGRLGEAPRPELREQGRISGACFDAARGFIPGLVDAHVKALGKAQPHKVGICLFSVVKCSYWLCKAFPKFPPPSLLFPYIRWIKKLIFFSIFFMSSFFVHNWFYLFFMSFRGEDVRRSFLSHIQKEFQRKGIIPFIDEEINRE